MLAYTPAFSALDASVNWTRRGDPGAIETRFVRRSDDYVVVYLSSQTGCRQACRMCHLTATGQTRTRDVTVAELFEQAAIVLDHAAHQARAPTVHFNFMARGEPLASQIVLDHADEILDGLWQRANQAGMQARFLVSTILPESLGDRSLASIFGRYHPELYYSLYSVDPAFRRRWLPRALPPDEALARLASWQRQTYKLVKIHYAFIAAENDASDHVHAVCDAIRAHELLCHVNVVRYNPASARCGTEPDEAVLQRNATIFAERLPGARVKIIPRVGFDVAASCGMFVAG